MSCSAFRSHHYSVLGSLSFGNSVLSSSVLRSQLLAAPFSAPVGITHGHASCAISRPSAINGGAPCPPHPWCSLLTPSHRYFVLTPSLVLRTPFIPDTSCSPHPRYSLLATSQLLRSRPVRYERPHTIQSGRQQPPFNLHPGTPSHTNPMNSMLTPSMVPRSHFILSVLFHSRNSVPIPPSVLTPYQIPHPGYSILTLSSVFRAHPILGTLFSSHEWSASPPSTPL